ncbi:MAG: hypothetical protein IOD12_05825 [Silvanigrellales bacterium]|jgi:hypothetical protein|nr:hypothetical protein [Silvanigrellales bacterium]
MNTRTDGRLSSLTAALLLSFTSLASVACSTEDPKQSKQATSASTSAVASSEARPVAAAPRQGIRGSSGDGENVVVRRADGKSPGGDLGLVAGCGEKKYDASKEASAAAAECDVSSESNEAR